RTSATSPETSSRDSKLVNHRKLKPSSAPRSTSPTANTPGNTVPRNGSNGSPGLRASRIRRASVLPLNENLRAPSWLRAFVFNSPCLLRGFYFQQFHVKDQHFIGPNVRPRAAVAVGQLRRDKELPLVPFLHQLQRLRPPWNHPIHRKRHRRSARRIK